MSEAVAPGRDALAALEDRLTAELEAIPGILAAAVWLATPTRLREGYISAAPGASLATLEQATHRLLSAHQVDFSGEQLHIALLDQAAAPPLWRGRYLILEGLEVARADNHVVCRVKLLRRGATITGEAREVDTEQGRARAAARATLHAAEQASNTLHFGLEGLHLQELFGRRYVTLSIEVASHRRPLHLPGIAALSRSIEEAACHATLHAIERWLSW